MKLVFARIRLSEAVQSTVWINFSFNMITYFLHSLGNKKINFFITLTSLENRKVTKEIPHVLVAVAKTSIFASPSGYILSGQNQRF